ncbi:MAG: GerMN domain-containing protein [Chloroflexota bacterium]
MRTLIFVLLAFVLVACGNADDTPAVTPTTEATATPETITVWLPSDDAISDESIPIGCETHITPVETEAFVQDTDEATLTTALETLFSTMPQEPFRNYWEGALTVESVSIDDAGLAVINITGDFLLIGTCSDAEISEQMALTVFQVDAIQSARIMVNGDNLVQMLDMSGQSSADAVFTRDGLPTTP